MDREAVLYTVLADGKVSCELCSHRCIVAPSKFGVCGVRQNKNGKLITHVYGRVIAAHVDPIEKKPLYHFQPGTHSFSIATIGCNFRCPFCQNWQISQSLKRKGEGWGGDPFPPEDIVRAAVKHRCRSIAYTYTEPTIFFEYACDTAKLAKKAGLTNVFVTNGYMSAEALETIHSYLDACNVDLKSFREAFYTKMCGAHIEPVLESIRLMKKLKIWVEVTTLIVPHENDSEEELAQIARFISGLDPDIPWHVSRFHPDYHYTEGPATPLETLRRAFVIGQREGLRHIYIGNVFGESEDTVCSRCQNVVIQRQGFSVTQNKLKDSRCPRCGNPVPGVYS